MHEFSVAAGIVEKVLDFFEQKKIRQVLAVKLGIGELANLEKEQLCFSYNAITIQTPIEGSKLEIETIEAAVECPHCFYRGRPSYWNEALVAASIPTLTCPQCGGGAAITHGQECEIKSIKVLQ